MAITKFLIPAAAVVVVVIAVVGFRGHGTNPVEQQGSSTSSEIDSIVNGMVNDAKAEQSVASEGDTDVQLIDSDRAAFDSFASTYNANEY